MLILHVYADSPVLKYWLLPASPTRLPQGSVQHHGQVLVSTTCTTIHVAIRAMSIHIWYSSIKLYSQLMFLNAAGSQITTKGWVSQSWHSCCTQTKECSSARVKVMGNTLGTFSEHLWVKADTCSEIFSSCTQSKKCLVYLIFIYSFWNSFTHAVLYVTVLSFSNSTLHLFTLKT